MQLPESDLCLDVSLLGEQLVVLDQVVVQDPPAERTVPATLGLVLRRMESFQLELCRFLKFHRYRRRETTQDLKIVTRTRIAKNV